MKCSLVLISVFFCIGVSHAFLEEVFESHQAKTLRRVARSTFSQIGMEKLPQIEALIISSCKAPESDELGDTLDEMKTCLSAKPFLLTPKDEFLDKLESCAEESVKKATECLPQEMKYFPKLLLDLAKAVVTFSYDNRELLKTELGPCLPNLNTYAVQRSYLECVSRVSKEQNDLPQIPSSANSFCSKLLPINDCFSNMLKDNCQDSEDMQTVRKNYVDAFKNVCEAATSDLEQNSV